MNRMSDIRARRAQLLARGAVERERLSVQLQAWETPLALADRALSAARYVRRHPQLLIAAAVVLAVLRPRRAFAWARRGFVAWRAWRWASASLRGLTAR